MKLQTVKKNVKSLLTLYPELRDVYPDLVITYWHKYDKVPSYTQLSDLGNHKLTSTESITRSSRSLQKEFKELRGNRYGKTEEIEKEYIDNFII